MQTYITENIKNLSATHLSTFIINGNPAGIANISSGSSPVSTQTLKCSKGDTAYFQITSSTAQAINDNLSQFAIILNTSIDITVWDAYETWKSLDPDRTNVTFDEWTNDELRQSLYNSWLDKYVGTKDDFLSWLKGSNSSGNVGEIYWWPLTTPPQDSLYCDGREVGRTAYRDLFDVIGTDFGEGDGESTFNLPDLRGEFVRGYDPEAVRDPDGITRKIGQHQNDAMQRITGSFNGVMPFSGHNAQIGTGSLRAISTNANLVQTPSAGSGVYWRPGSMDIDTSRQARTAAETRPTNVNLLPCIRYRTIATGFTNDELDQQHAMLAWSKAEIGVEYWTGKYHTDGKKVYGKKIDFGALPNATTKTVPHNVINIHEIISLTGVAPTLNTGAPSFSLPAVIPTNAPISVGIGGGGSGGIENISITTGMDRRHMLAIATIEYTCTDR